MRARENVVAACVLFVLVTLMLFPFLFGDRTLEDGAARASSLYGAGSTFAQPVVLPPRESDPNAGALGSGQLALEHAIVAREGTAPLWNPYSSYGAPLAADMQAQPYSAFAWIPLVWSSPRGFAAYVAIRIFAGGLLAFLFLRQFTGVAPALAGGASYLFAGYLWLYLTTPQLSVEVLAPGLLLAVERALRRPRFATALVFAAMFAFCVLGGMPEATALAVTFAFVYAIARCLGDPELRRSARTSAAFLALGTVCGAALSAILVLPFLEFAGVSSNSHQPGGAASLLGAPADPLSLRALAQYVAPLLYGPPGTETANGIALPPLRGFFGASAVFFALIAAFGRLRDAMLGKRDEAPIAILSIVTLVLLCKRFGFAFVEWLGALPVFRVVIFEKYEEAIVACCVALLAGFGIARVLERRSSAADLWLAFAMPLAVLSGVAALDQATMLGGDPAGQASFFRALAVALVSLSFAACVAFAALRGFWSVPKLAGILMCAIVALEVPVAFVLPLYRIGSEEPAASASPMLGAPYLDFVRAHLANGERFFGEDFLLVPNWNEALEIPDVRGVDAIYWERFLPFVRAFLPSQGFELVFWFRGTGDVDFSTALERKFLELSSVRYIATLHPIGGPPSAATAKLFRPVYVSPGAVLYEFTAPLPRIAAYRHVVRASDGPSALALLASPHFDVRSEAVVEGDSAELAALERAAPSAVTAGRFEHYGTRDVRATVTATGPSLVVLNDSDFPGWSATVDGAPAAILRADYLFRGLVVPAGTHVIEYRYEPASFRAGAAISIGALLAVAASCAVLFLRRRAGGSRRALQEHLAGAGHGTV